MAMAADINGSYKKRLYTDLDKLKKDEQHYFELLLVWGVMTEKIDLP